MGTVLRVTAACGLYALCFKRLNVLGRVAGGGVAVLLLLATSLYWPDRPKNGRAATPYTTTEHADQFALGLTMGLFALFVDFVLLVPLFLFLWKQRGKPVAKPVWISFLAVPVLVAIIGAAGAR